MVFDFLWIGKPWRVSALKSISDSRTLKIYREYACALYISIIYLKLMDTAEKLLNCSGFDWGGSNAEKNWVAHRVNPSECEQVFFNEPLIVADDIKHSQQECRYYVLGQTDEKRPLFIIFTIRKNLIRVISARDMSRKERTVYKTS